MLKFKADTTNAGQLGTLQTRHQSNSAPVDQIRHLLNSALVKLGTYTFKSMFKQYYILNVNLFTLRLDLHFNINFLTILLF